MVSRCVFWLQHLPTAPASRWSRGEGSLRMPVRIIGRGVGASSAIWSRENPATNGGQRHLAGVGRFVSCGAPPAAKVRVCPKRCPRSGWGEGVQGGFSMFHPAPASLGLAALPAAWAECAHPARARRAEAAELDRYFSASGHRDSIPAWPVVLGPVWRQRPVAWYDPAPLLARFSGRLFLVRGARSPRTASSWRAFFSRG